ncbi:class I SAM-dependent methyltransferase [Lysinibacillus sp. RC79]|uniref:class I SAM-dependent methyltransferase n=1 Tax=Lysinibacillus sp. RC79 TaxID=3156296 RepID=UPI0035142DB7
MIIEKIMFCLIIIKAFLLSFNLFLKTRKKIFQEVPFQSKQKILYVGIATGADLELINYVDYDITAIDFSPDMLNKAKSKFERSAIKFLEINAQKMAFEDESFDYIVASLILSVVPDENKCFGEMIRVLKKDGRILIFDKFAPKNKKNVTDLMSALQASLGKTKKPTHEQRKMLKRVVLLIIVTFTVF